MHRHQFPLTPLLIIGLAFTGCQCSTQIVVKLIPFWLLFVPTSGVLVYPPQTGPIGVTSGGTVTLFCSTTETEKGVGWWCDNDCAGRANITSNAIIFLDKQLRPTFVGHVTIITDKPGQYDLHIARTTTSDSGIYYCRDKNALGSETVSYELRVTEPTASPTKQLPFDSAITRWPTGHATLAMDNPSSTSEPDASSASVYIGIIGGTLGGVLCVSIIVVVLILLVRHNRRTPATYGTAEHEIMRPLSEPNSNGPSYDRDSSLSPAESVKLHKGSSPITVTV